MQGYCCSSEFGVALLFRVRYLSLPRAWVLQVQEVIEEGPRCVICLNVAIPHGKRNPHAPKCKRCQVGREARAKLIDFWNHFDEHDGVTSKFWLHAKFECVCEKEAVLTTTPESSESEEDHKEEEIEEAGDGEEAPENEEEEYEWVDPRDLE